VRKYDSVIEKLQPAPVADPRYQEKVEAAKVDLTLDPTSGELVKMTPEALAEAYAALRTKDAEIDAERYKLQLKITALEQMLASSWEADEAGWGTYGAGPNTLRMRSGYSVVVEQVPEGKVEDPEAFRLWCIAAPDVCMTCGIHVDSHDDAHPFKAGGGMEKKLQLWPSTMNAIAKERCLAGAPPPDGVSVHARTKIKLRKQ
jgi:hypothetical protein